jgi:hypothetical protein
MRVKIVLAACLIALPAFALAQPEEVPEAQSTFERIEEILSPSSILKGQITERDVDELFDLLRAMIAGNPREPSEELKQKLDRLATRLMIRGGMAGELLLDEIESRLKQKVRELNEPDSLPGAI